MDKKRFTGVLIFLLAASFPVFAQTRIAAKAGKNITITLPSNPTTGYGWRLAGPTDNKIVMLLLTRYVPGNMKLSGAPGKEIWVFKAAGAGTAVLEFEYVRSWEKGIPPAQKETYEVVVQ